MLTIYLRYSGGPSVSISKDVLKSNFQGRQIYSRQNINQYDFLP